MKRTMTAVFVTMTITASGLSAGMAGASVAAKADPQKVCDAIASEPESAKDELAAIRLAQSGKNPELTKPLAAMEKAAQKAVKTKKSAPVETEAYDANLEKVFAFGYENCTDVQVEGTLGADGLSGFPASVEAGTLGVKLTNDTDGDVGFGVIRVDDDNTATTDEIVTALFAADEADEEPDGIRFVGGGGATAGGAGYAVSPVDAGRYIVVVYSEADEDSAAAVAEFTVS